jgi:hypothetical protein
LSTVTLTIAPDEEGVVTGPIACTAEARAYLGVMFISCSVAQGSQLVLAGLPCGHYSQPSSFNARGRSLSATAITAAVFFVRDEAVA